MLAHDDPNGPIMAPMQSTSPAFRRWAIGLGAIVVWAIAAWCWQLWQGLGVTDLGRPVFWGLYITNFVFFIGVSYGGTLTSAVLRILGAEWRRPITRMAEVISVLVLFFGVINILLDLGRPEHALQVMLHPNFVSPLIWDVFSINLYLLACLVYLYLPLIPDIALMRDRSTGWRLALYRRLAIGWTGTPRQWHRLEQAITAMAIAIIPIAVSVHSVVAWVFAMTVQPMWHSTIFGPYFVMGAIFSGLASIIIVMAVVRRAHHLEGYVTPLHFNNLSLMLLVMVCIWFYFTFAEYLTTWYGQEPTEMAVFNAKFFGAFAPHFWAMFVFCFLLPFVILVNSRTRTVTGSVVASVSVMIGMWLERYTIVVPSLSSPRAAIHTFNYTGSWVEWSLMAGCMAAFALLYMGFTKLFPIISIWELQEPAPADDTVPRTAALPTHP